jgi:DNA-binding GntR family transcriptional regulator
MDRLRIATSEAMLPPMTSVRLQRQPLARSVYQLVTEMLLTNGLPPGARLSIEDLARNLGVSQTPVREALAGVEADGLIIKEPGRSYRVAPMMTIDQVRELTELRLLLEPAVAAKAARHSNTAAVTELRTLARSMRTGKATEGTTSRDDMEHDAAFHQRIAVLAGNGVIAETLQRLRGHVHTYRLHYNAGPATTTRKEHLAIVKAIADRDPVAADAAMRAHLTNAQDRMEVSVAQAEAQA